MTFLVPYDGSELARAALVRAEEYAGALDEDVTVVTVVPQSKRYAREKEWIPAGGDFDVREVIGDRHEEVTELVPEASFRAERVDASAAAGTVASTIRRVAAEESAALVFLGGGVRLALQGTPGNDVGAFMDGAEITVRGNVQDGVGNTMNAGRIVVPAASGGGSVAADESCDVHLMRRRSPPDIERVRRKPDFYPSD